MNYKILVGNQKLRINTALTYACDKKLKTGSLVEVPLRNSTAFGIVVGISTDFNKKIRDIKTIFPYVFDKNIMELIKWFIQYYPSPLSSIAQLFLPSKTPILTDGSKGSDAPSAAVLQKLNALQKKVVEAVTSSSQNNFLLYGVTGSGKTRVYLELIKKTISEGKTAIILTPEIGLTAPLLETVSSAFKGTSIVSFNSRMSSKQRLSAWTQTASLKQQPQIIIGPRSALFLPYSNLGLIIVDESHDNAYKQSQQPFYHATRVAAKLANIWNAKCVFGSATPNVVDYHAFKQAGLPILKISETAIPNNYKRKDEIIDLRDKSNFSRSDTLSDNLLNAIGQAILDKKQTLLFLNRRGTARTIVCQNCGWKEQCPRCDTSLTYHSDKNTALCHTCAFNKRAPTKCPECASSDIIFQTPGTKSIETEVKKLFPQAKVARFDKDSSAANQMSRIYKQVASGEIDILIGTQILAKGFDLPKLAVIGLIQADVSMSLPDYTSTEKTFQLISQVVGRVGRGHGDSKLFVQTFEPTSPVIQQALAQQYEQFYENEIYERNKYNFPPNKYLLQIKVKRSTQRGARSAITKIFDSLSKLESINVSPPTPCFYEKRAGNFYWQVVVRAKKRHYLTQIISQLPPAAIYNIDPVDLL